MTDEVWLRREHRRLFSLAPFVIRDGDPSIATEGLSAARRRVGGRSFVLVASFASQAVVKRLTCSPDEAARAARDLAAMTGDVTVIGRQVALDESGLPVFESVGRVLTAKIDPMSPEAFEAWTEQLAGNILRVSRADMAAMGAEALEHFAFNFQGASVQQMERALLGYRTTIGTPTARMMNVQRLEISRALRGVLTSTTRATMRIPEVRANIGTGFNIPDRRVANLLSQHHSFWVRDRHGQISQSMSAQARNIISAGVERGAGNREIGRELAGMTGRGIRQPGYYQTVAANHVSRARSYSTGRTMRAAGIEFYRIEAVLDDRTTHQCNFLHQKLLPVGPAMARMDRTLRSNNPEAVLVHHPFIQQRGNELQIPNPDGTMARVATIDTSGPAPTYSNPMPPGDMVDHAIGLPPYHHGCRTTTVPA